MDIFGKMEKCVAMFLLAFLGIVVIAAAVEISYKIVNNLIQPLGFFLGVTELIDTFGLFLMVPIGLELMATMKMYLSEHTIQVEMMFLVAMTAVARNAVILDTVKNGPLLVFGVGFLILALSTDYFLIRKKMIGCRRQSNRKRTWQLRPIGPAEALISCSSEHAVE